MFQGDGYYIANKTEGSTKLNSKIIEGKLYYIAFGHSAAHEYFEIYFVDFKKKRLQLMNRWNYPSHYARYIEDSVTFYRKQFIGTPPEEDHVYIWTQTKHVLNALNNGYGLTIKKGSAVSIEKISILDDIIKININNEIIFPITSAEFKNYTMKFV